MTIDQLNKLTDEDVRVRVAERMGYSDIHFDAGYGAICGRIHHPDDWSEYLPVPHYPTDLNAMHEAEKMLSDAQDLEFTFILLNKICQIPPSFPGSRDWHFYARGIHATARQRALAFLAVTEREEG